MKTILSRTLSLVQKRKNLLTQAGKYFIVGGVCTVLDFCLLFVLKEYFAVPLITASVASFMAGALINYYLCTLWIFKVRRVTDWRLEMMLYIIITMVGLGINAAIIWVLTDYFGYYFMLSKLAATFVTYWWNFGARKYFLHRNMALHTNN